MAAKKLSKSEFIKEGWKVTRKNFTFLFSVFVIFVFVGILRSGFQSVVRSLEIASAISLIFYVIQVVMEIGLTKITLDLIDGKKGNLHDLYLNYKLFFNFFLASLFYGIVVFVGFILLIVPGIYFAVKYQLFGFLVVDKKVGPGEALQLSAKMTKGRLWFIFVFDLILIGLNILGVFAFIIGLLVTIPVSMLAAAALYRRLSA